MKKKLFLLLCALLTSAGMWADVQVPCLHELDDFGGTAVSSMSTFVPSGSSYTLELTGCVAGTEITVPGGSFSYTPTTSGTVRFVNVNGTVHVYEGTSYKGTVSVSTPAAPTFPANPTSASVENIIQNGGFEDTSDGTYTTGRYKPTHWNPYNSSKTAPDNGTSVRPFTSLNGSYAMLFHNDGSYLTQQLASGVMKNNTPYQISYKYRANTTGQAGAKYKFQVGNEEFASNYYSSGESNKGTESAQTFSATFVSPSSIVTQPYVQIYRSTYDANNNNKQDLDYIDEIILVAATGGGIGITGATGATFLSGTGYAPEGVFEANTTATLAEPVATTLVINGTFDSGITGWTSTTGAQNNKTASNKQGAFTGNFYENWNGSNFTGKQSQTLNNVPNGTYKLNICAFVDKVDSNRGQYVYVNSNKSYVYTTTPTAYTVYTYVTDHTLEYGLQQDNSVNNWMGIDNVSLEYCSTSDVVTAGFKSIYDNLVALPSDPEYVNVTGSERTNLETAIDNNSSPAANADGYAVATFNINLYVNPFIDAKENYDQYAEAAAVATTIGATSVTVPTTSAEALTRANELNVNIDTKVTSTYTYDVTDTYAGSFSGTLSSTNNNQHWSATTIDYLDNYGTGDQSASQTLSLPAGEYVLKMAGRGATSANAITMSAAGQTVNFKRKGDTGRGITKAGVANFAEVDDTYANNNNGRGWEWRYIPLSLGSTTDVTVTLTLARPASGNTWGSFSDFKILMSSTDADADDYDALNAAITTAEDHTLGFEDGEYAPYNNVAALEELAFAKSIDQKVTNAKGVVTSATSALEAVNASGWTANDGDVDIVYNGNFAIANGNNPKGWTRSNNGAWGQQITGLSAAANDVNEGTTTAWYYNTNGAWEYGKDDVYKMPLAASQSYKLSFKYRSHAGDSNNGMKASVLNDSDEGLAEVSFAENDDATKFITATAYFTTGAAGNYVLSLTQSGNTHLTDVSIERVESTTVTIAETATSAVLPEKYAYADVTLTRTLSSSYWNTFSVPFDAAIPSEWTVKEFDSTDDNVINFKDATTIVAGKPYLVKPTSDEVNPTFNGVIVKNIEGTIDGTGDYKFAGQIYNKDLSTGGTIAYLATDGKIMKLTSGGIKGLRAYFIIPSSGASARIAFIDDDTTGINAIEAAETETEGLKDGKYLIEGKIVIVNNGVKYSANGQKLN